MKPVRFMGSAKEELSAFPDSAKLRAGHELFMVQVGRDPDDWNREGALSRGEGARRQGVTMAKKMTKSSGNIFLDLGFPPHEASVMLLRAQLAEVLRAWMERERLTQAQAAKRLGISQPRVSEIVRGKVELLSLDYLFGLCAKAKLDVGLRLAA
jgi:predicted XRE-type DNA-binding protein